MKLISYDSRAAQAAGLAGAIADQLRAAIAHQGRASLCVAGGTTPAPMFAQLSTADLDWRCVTILLTDERWVPVDDARSNAALIAQHLRINAAQDADFVGMYSNGMTPEEGAQSAARCLAPHMPITVLVAGMGADMHTASLFPDADTIGEAMADNAPPVLVMRPKSAPEARLTLSAPVLRAAAHCHILITGQDKLAVLNTAHTLPATAAPVGILLPHADVHWAE